MVTDLKRRAGCNACTVACKQQWKEKIPPVSSVGDINDPNSEVLKRNRLCTAFLLKNGNGTSFDLLRVVHANGGGYRKTETFLRTKEFGFSSLFLLEKMSWT
jgi:hypothetical protein